VGAPAAGGAVFAGSSGTLARSSGTLARTLAGADDVRRVSVCQWQQTGIPPRREQRGRDLPLPAVRARFIGGYSAAGRLPPPPPPPPPSPVSILRCLAVPSSGTVPIPVSSSSKSKLESGMRPCSRSHPPAPWATPHRTAISGHDNDCAR